MYLIRSFARKLSDPQLQRVLADLYKLFYDLPAHLRREEIATREFIVQVRSRLSEDQDDDLDASPASMMAEWMKSYLRYVYWIIVIAGPYCWSC